MLVVWLVYMQLENRGRASEGKMGMYGISCKQVGVLAAVAVDSEGNVEKVRGAGLNSRAVRAGPESGG